MSEIKPTRGSVSFKSSGHLTMEQIGQMVAEAIVIGIPANAQVTNVYFRWGSAPTIQSEIDISWQVGNQW